jgi:uncharacterized protein (UPF0548 family)
MTHRTSGFSTATPRHIENLYLFTPVGLARTVRRMGLVVGVVDDAALLGLAECARDLPLSYQNPGVTNDLGPARVEGFRVDRDSIDLDGNAAVLFETAREALRSWAVHRGAGLRVAPSDAPLATGVPIVVAIKLPFVTAIAPCRIVWTVDEVDRFGFAYGTLVGHPEAGESPSSSRGRRQGSTSRSQLFRAQLGFSVELASRSHDRFNVGRRSATSPPSTPRLRVQSADLRRRPTHRVGRRTARPNDDDFLR